MRATLVALACGLASACTSADTAESQPPAAHGEAAADEEWTEGGSVATEVDGIAQEQAGDPVGAAATEEAAEAVAPADGDADAEGEPAPGTIATSGTLNTRYIGRWGEGEDDHDLYSLLGATVGDPEEDPYSAYLLGRVSWDVDGDQGDEDSPFFSLEDTYDHSLNGRVYEAYLDLNDTGLDLLRFGRQALYETPAYVRFDGAALSTERAGEDDHELGAYGGRTVHEYESSPEGDAVYGAYASNSMWKGGRTRLDYMHLEDEQQLGDERDDLWATQVQQVFGREVRLESGYSWLEGAPREFDARATWLPYEAGWLVQGSYYALLQTEGSLAEEIDPFFDTLQEYFPYSLSRLLVSKTFETGWSLEGGADLRDVDDSEDEGEFNRDYERYHLTSTIEDFVVEDLALALTGDYWTSDGSDTNSWGVDLTRELSEKLRGSIGSFYQLYKNDFLLDEEREDVRTYYVSLRWRPEKRLTWGLGLEHEDTDIGDFDTLTARSTWNF